MKRATSDAEAADAEAMALSVRAKLARREVASATCTTSTVHAVQFRRPGSLLSASGPARLTEPHCSAAAHSTTYGGGPNERAAADASSTPTTAGALPTSLFRRPGSLLGASRPARPPQPAAVDAKPCGSQQCTLATELGGHDQAHAAAIFGVSKGGSSGTSSLAAAAGRERARAAKAAEEAAKSKASAYALLAELCPSQGRTTDGRLASTGAGDGVGVAGGDEHSSTAADQGTDEVPFWATLGSGDEAMARIDGDWVRGACSRLERDGSWLPLRQLMLRLPLRSRGDPRSIRDRSEIGRQHCAPILRPGWIAPKPGALPLPTFGTAAWLPSHCVMPPIGTPPQCACSRPSMAASKTLCSASSQAAPAPTLPSESTACTARRSCAR